MSLPDPRNSRAVLIGTSEYESLPQLEAVTANVEHLKALFSANDLWGLPPENCTVICRRGLNEIDASRISLISSSVSSCT